MSLSGGAGAAVAATPPASGPLDLRSFGAVGDGTTDDSTALQHALDALSANGGGELLISNGVYRIATPVLANFQHTASTIVISGVGSASQILIATGAGKVAIDLQDLEGVLFENLTFVGTPGVQSDALIALSLDSCLQATIRRCDFYGVSSYETNGAVVMSTGSSLRIEDSAFRGCGGRSGVNASVVTNQNWVGLTIVRTDFLDYGYLNGTFMSKTAIAAPFAWVALYNISTQAAPPAQEHVYLNTVSMDEGAPYAVACLPNAATSGRIASAVLDGLRVNVAGFATPNNGVIIQGVDHVTVRNSWFGYAPNYGSRNAVTLRGVSDAVIDSCRCEQGADRILADNAVGSLTVRETTYQHLLSSAGITEVVKGGLKARVLQADGAIPANNLVVASPGSNQRVVAAPTGAAASAIVGVTLDATVNPGDSTRIVMARGSVVPIRSDGTATITAGDAIGPSAVFGGRAASVSSGAIIGRALQNGAASSAVFVPVELIDGVLGPGSPLTPLLQNGWANFGGGFATASYTKSAEGWISLSGLIKGGTIATGTVLLNLPKGYRPANALVFAVASSGGYAELSITPDGNLAARQLGSQTYLSLDGIRFARA